MTQAKPHSCIIFASLLAVILLAGQSSVFGRSKSDSLEAIMRIARISWSKGALKQTLIKSQQAMDLAEHDKLEKEYVEASILNAYAYDALGDYKRSSELFFTCLEKSEKIIDKKLIYKSLYGIGFSCFSQGNYNKALEYYQKALSLSREIKDTAGISGALNNISAVYGSLNDTLFIESYIRQALAINLRMKNYSWVSINYGNLGQFFLKRKTYDSAYACFHRSYEISKVNGDVKQLASTSANLANFYFVRGDFGNALLYAQESFKISQISGFRKNVYEASRLLRDIYLQKKDLAEAYHFDTLRFLTKDSLDLDGSKATISRLELNYEMARSLQERQLKEYRYQAIILIALIIVASLIVIIVLLYRRHGLKSRYLQLEKNKLEGELEFRNKELASNVMSLLKKNELLAVITQRLLDVYQRTANEETRNEIEHIAHDLQKSIGVEIWNEFDVRFKQVHKDFYDNLLRKFPDLSPNEQKLCAFLRLNMSNKEISELTGQSIKALETARYRLRIKLGISNSAQNLIAYLSSF